MWLYTAFRGVLAPRQAVYSANRTRGKWGKRPRRAVGFIVTGHAVLVKFSELSILAFTITQANIYRHPIKNPRENSHFRRPFLFGGGGYGQLVSILRQCARYASGIMPQRVSCSSRLSLNTTSTGITSAKPSVPRARSSRSRVGEAIAEGQPLLLTREATRQAIPHTGEWYNSPFSSNGSRREQFSGP